MSKGKVKKPYYVHTDVHPIFYNAPGIGGSCSLGQCYSQSSPWTSNISTTWYLTEHKFSGPTRALLHQTLPAWASANLGFSG